MRLSMAIMGTAESTSTFVAGVNLTRSRSWCGMRAGDLTLTECQTRRHRRTFNPLMAEEFI